MKKLFKNTLPILVAAAVAMPTALTTAARSWDLDVEKYDEEITSYAVEHGNSTDRFTFPNGHYKKYFEDGSSVRVLYVKKDDPNYIDFLKKCSNVNAVIDPFDLFSNSALGGSCLGISSLAVLTHNGVIKASDIQADKENLIDITMDNDVMSTVLAYQLRQQEADFTLLRFWSLSHYTDEERIDMLIEDAQKASEEGKYFIINMFSNKNFNHAVAGMGIISGEFEHNGEIYDKCIPIYDSNYIIEDENTDTISQATDSHTCLFINSETRKTYYPAYDDETGEEIFSYFSIYDDDFINYKGKFNPTSSYKTDVSDLNCIEIKSKNPYDVLLTRADGTEYDGVAESGTMLGTYDDAAYCCDGKTVHVKNSGNAADFLTNIETTRSYIESAYKGSVDNIYKDDNHFSFDANGETKYNVILVFEEGGYSFSPHFRYDLSGVTDSDFSAEVTDRGIILSGNKGVKCTLKTSDVKRDEEGMLISAEDNVWNDAIDTFGSVMVAFDEENRLKYYIGDNYDIEVQKGNVNCDGVIDSRDASILLNAYVNQSNDVSLVLGDYDENGVIDARDASAVLTYYVTSDNK